MVCCTQFGLLLVLCVFCSVMHVFPIGLAVITFLDERKTMMKQLPELQTLLIPDNDRTLTAAYLMVLGSIGMLLNNFAVVRFNLVCLGSAASNRLNLSQNAKLNSDL